MIIASWLLPGCFPVAFWLLFGCFLVAFWLLSGCFLVAFWLLSGCFLVAFWLLSGCLLLFVCLRVCVFACLFVDLVGWWALLLRILVPKWHFYDTRERHMSICHQHVDLLLALPMCTFTENPCVIIRFLHRLTINISCVLSNMFIFHWKSVSLGPQRASCITFYIEIWWFLQKVTILSWKYVQKLAEGARHCSEKRLCRWNASQWSTGARA